MALAGEAIPWPTDSQRLLATVVRIDEIVKHQNADTLSIATVKGWPVIIQTREFQPGDFAVYCEIDSIIPRELLVDTPFYDILEPRKFTIKTIKLRGEYSQGILLPISFLDRTEYARQHGCSVRVEGDCHLSLGELALEVGADVTDLLGVTKHEAPIFSEETAKPGKIKGNFPCHLFPRTDEERVQNLPNLLIRAKGLEFFVTEKVDGTSYSCYRKHSKRGHVFGVCSRNNELVETEDDFYWRVTRRLDIEAKLEVAGLSDIALQGELLGPSIQTNRYRLLQQTVLFFNVYDIKEERHMPSKQARHLVEAVLGLQWVPVVSDCFVMNHTVGELVAMADGKSCLNPALDREGLVFRTVEERRDTQRGRFSFKCISNRFLMKFDGVVTGSEAPKMLTEKAKKNNKKKKQREEEETEAQAEAGEEEKRSAGSAETVPGETAEGVPVADGPA